MRFRGAIAFLVICLWAGAAMSAERVALVMGIADYQSIGPLKNTINDARRISETLEQIGFDVTTAFDATSQQMHDLLEEFAFRSETADLALIYFAGHGVEVQGENFLIPADAQVASNADIQRQAVSLKDMLVAVDKARKMRIVILDSCRNNPFGDLIDTSETTAEGGAGASETRGGGGLAQPAPDRGTLVSFAAKDGNVALDGSGDNSPFALALSDRLKQPNLEISLMFRQVRDQVLQSTANQQEPHTYGSLSGVPFYLAGTDGTEAAVDDRRIAWSDLRPEQEAQLTRLADGGDTRSMLGLGYMRLNPDTERFDPAAAADLFTRAADAGAPEAQFELAKLYEQGLGVPQDPAQALALYQASAAQDFADAINDLGFFYYQGGLGLPRDPQQALSLFERAADLRHPQAMFNFAALIDDGLIAGKGAEESASYLYNALRTGSDDVLKIMTEQPRMFSIDTRKALQRKLQEVAFYDGAIDGDFGPGTQRSIRRAYGLTD